MRLLLLSLTAGGVILTAQEGYACSGDREEHRPSPDFHFFTTSAVEDRDSRPVGRTCVDNQSSGDMEVHWFIPGPSGWVPEGAVYPKERYLRSEEEALPLKGCLEYGNRGEVLPGGGARFWGDQREGTKAEEEERSGCIAARDRYHRDLGHEHEEAAATLPLEETTISPLEVFVQAFFPSDRENPSETMLQLDGIIALKPEGETAYQIVFALDLSPYDDRLLGDPSAVFATPFFPTPAERLYEWYFEAIPDSASFEELAERRGFFVELGSPKVLLEEAYLIVMTDAGEQVARIGFPVFVEASQ